MEALPDSLFRVMGALMGASRSPTAYSPDLASARMNQRLVAAILTDNMSLNRRSPAIDSSNCPTGAWDRPESRVLSTSRQVGTA